MISSNDEQIKLTRHVVRISPDHYSKTQWMDPDYRAEAHETEATIYIMNTNLKKAL